MPTLWQEHRGHLWRDLGRVLTAVLVIIAVVDRPAAAQKSPTPEPQGYRGASQAQAYQGAFSDLANEIDVFWSEAFQADGISYESPNIVVVELPTPSSCGLIVPQPNAFYCRPDRTIYLVPQFLVDLQYQFGDYAPITVLSHEWGHHIQALLGIVGTNPKEFELQADCLMGVFTRFADDQGLLDYGDFLEAIETSEEGGDPVFLPEDDPDAHGQAEDRVKALTKGFGGGPATGCGLRFSPSYAPTAPPTASRTWTPAPPSRTPTLSSTLTPTPMPNPNFEPPPLLESLWSLSHSACFGVDNDGTLPFSELAARLGGTDDASRRLQEWGWQASAYRTFVCGEPPDGEVGWVEINAHRFGDATSAQQAVDYFADVRAEGTWLTRGPQPAVGDYAVSLAGPDSNGTDGTEVTIYANQGPILVRVTGVASSGIPFGDVQAITQAVLNLQLAAPQSPAVELVFVPSAAYLPVAPDVNYGECFSIYTEGAYSSSDVGAALLPTGLTQAEFDGLGWRDGAYRVFTCAEPPSGRASQIDVGIHQFQDESSAQQALPYYSIMYETGENMSRSCDTAGALVVCVSGRSHTGSPLSDVHFVLQQVVGSVG